MQLIILDRDGVINYDSENYIKSPEEWVPIPGSLAAIARLNALGYRVVVATNQSGIGRGLYTEEILKQIHQKCNDFLAPLKGKIEKFFYCPHIPDDFCNCRKPKPGLLQQIAAYYNISLLGIPFIGDSWRDIQAAQTMDCESILVKTGKGMQTIEKTDIDLSKVSIYDDLYHFTQQL